MRYRHHVAQTARRIRSRFPFLRNITLTTSILTLIWFYIIYSGERSTFASHVKACHWDKWEEWPHHAKPHRLVFIADPQLVDPHTYPGRPWPLSSLTETFTDLYMSRNFRLVNEQLDPDSIVFLGDLFDGGREWRTERARPLNSWQREVLEKLAILKEGEPEGQKRPTTDEFVAGENGRWLKYGDNQWNSEYERFGRIFFDKKQLYPKTERSLVPTWLIPDDPVTKDNGAPSLGWHEYAISGKHREVKTSLPGNHDLGFGSGVQSPVRTRFERNFGDTNSIYVLGNHTFVSLDVPSLSAFNEYSQEEMTEARANYYYHLWKPANDFLDELSSSAPKTVGRHLNQYYPGAHPESGYWHGVTAAQEESLRGKRDLSKNTRKPKLPVVLLSHVPLFRNPDTDCGRLRENGKAITIARGYQYQNVLTPTVSAMITKKVSEAGDIEHIFSGDDHDYCDITHRFNVGRWNEAENKEQVVMRTIREITVKSFSWAMGVRLPGFLLVSLWNPVDDMGNTVGEPLPTIQSHLCLLPDQLSIFIKYALLLGWTLVILIIRAIVIGVRNKPITEDEEAEDDIAKFALPKYKPRLSPKPSPNGRANGYASPNKDQSAGAQGRQRASSTSNSLQNALKDNQNLSVQRSVNARTRSVSPNVTAASALNMGEKFNPTGPLIDRAGYFPSLRWQDPDDSDEESHIGEDDKDEKWKRRKRTPTKARRALNEFVVSLVFVAVPAGMFYGMLIRNG